MSCKMSKKRQYTKDAIDNALKFIENNEGSIRQAAKKFEVPRSSLQFKIRNPNTKFKSGPDPVLTEAEENSLCEFIILLAKRGFPQKKEDIQICVQDFLKKNPRPNPFRENKPGEVWFKAFLKRHPNISIRTSEGVTNASACVSEQDIRKWFDQIMEYFEENELLNVISDPTRVFNADETGFNVCQKTGKVLAEKGCKNVYEIEKASAKENITVLFTFSAAGFVCNPMIIYPYKRIPDRVTLSVPTGWGIGRSDSGWMTAGVFHDYIENCFYPELLKNNIPLPVVLFVDGHKTHLTIEVSNLCRSLKIHLVALYPNSTRILQPADVAAFRPIKAGWKKALREWYSANNYQTALTKETFAPLLKTVVDSSAKKDTLINGFRVSGLFPFDSNNVDFSKCIATAKPQENVPAPDMTLGENLRVLTFSEFCEIVGESILTKCQTTTPLVLFEADESFKAIYKMWQKFHGLCDPNSMENLQSDPSELEQIEVNNKNEMTNPNPHSIEPLQPDPLEENDETQNNTNWIETLPPGSLEQMESTENTNSVESVQPGPPKQNTAKLITIISNVSLSDYLKNKQLPDSPKRKGKRQLDHTPFALTSDRCLEIMKAKKLKKVAEEAAKEERKRLREEKRKEEKPKKSIKKYLTKESKNKSKNKEIKKPDGGNRIICCDACLSPILKKIIECSQCRKNYHLNCIPQTHRVHVPEEDDDEFLCHVCYHESNTDASDGDDDDLLNSIQEEAIKQGF